MPRRSAVVEVGGRLADIRRALGPRGPHRRRTARRGVARGDRVAIRLQNGIDWCLLFSGAQLAGAVAVPVNTRFTEDEAAYVINDSGSVCTFAPDARCRTASPFVVEDLQPDDLAAIFYTSGTTGFPKGAMTSHDGFTAASENTFRILQHRSFGGTGNATPGLVPLFHVTGCNSQLHPRARARRQGRASLEPARLRRASSRAVGEHVVNQVVTVPAI